MTEQNPAIVRGVIDLSNDSSSGSDSIDIEEEFDDQGIDNYDNLDYTELFEQLDRPKLTLDNSFFANLLINSNLVIPQFQRNYAWDDDNHEQLWYNLREQILELNEIDTSQEKLSESFFGAIHVAEEDSDNNKLQVIDGQQRLATVAIILNVLRQRLNSNIQQIDDPTGDTIEFIKNQYVDRVIYDDSSAAGRSRKLNIQLRGHDNDYFKLLFDDSPDRILRIILKELNEPKQGEEIRIDTLLNKLGIEEGDLSRDIPNKKRYYAKSGSHNKLLNANIYYENAIEDLLNETLELDEGEYIERALAMLNISQILLRSFRIIRSKLNETVSAKTKVQVFQSLNETGKSLSTAEKIRARIVAYFGFDSDEVARWETITQLFGDDSSKIEVFLRDYILAKSQEYNDQSMVGNNLLDAFSLSEKRRSELDSYLIADDDTSPTEEIADLEQGAGWYKEVDRNKLSRDVFNDTTDYYKTTQYLDRLDATTRRWMPFVFLLYSELSNDDATMNGETVVEMMDTIENIMIRQSLTGARTTEIATTFTTSCSYFNKEKIPETSETSIDELKEFNPLNRDLLTELLLVDTNLDELGGKSLVNPLTYESNWSQLKQVLVRLSIEELENSSKEAGRRTTRQQTNLLLDDLEIEHILPQKPTIEDAENSDIWLVKFFKLADHSLPGSITETDLDAYDYVDDTDEANPATKRVHQTFIQDPGNTILLHKTINRKISNSPFSIKLLFYYLTQYKDLKETNEYIADLENLDTNWSEIVKLIQSLSESAGLKRGEIRILFSRLVSISELEPDKIRDQLDINFSSGWELERGDDIGDEYENVRDFFDKNDITESDHKQLFNREWNRFEFKKKDDQWALATDDDIRTYWVFIDDMVESILLKIKREVDVTNEDKVDDIVIEFNGKWTWTQMKERKADLVEKTLKSLEFRSREINSENINKDRIRSQIEQSLEM